MKKIIIQLIVLTLVMALMGCAPTKKNENVTQPVTDSGKSVVEAIVEDSTTTDSVQQTASTEEKQKYIDLELVDKDGNPAKLSDYEGKFIALNFFGVWCKYCMEEMPDLQEVYSQYEGDDFVILLVNATTTENIGKEGVKKWYEDGGYTMPMVLDLDGKALEIYPVSGFPTTYFIDKEGYILGAVPGMMTKDMLLSVLETYNK